MLDDGFDALVKDRIAQEKEVVDAQRKAMQNFVQDYARKKQELELLGIKNVEEYRLKLLDDFNKKKQHFLCK